VNACASCLLLLCACCGAGVCYVCAVFASTLFLTALRPPTLAGLASLAVTSVLQLQQVVAETAALKERQETPDPPEALTCIPSLHVRPAACLLCRVLHCCFRNSIGCIGHACILCCFWVLQQRSQV
jgi:hypothetical protein